jgi:hypothetical protein
MIIQTSRAEFAEISQVVPLPIFNFFLLRLIIDTHFMLLLDSLNLSREFHVHKTFYCIKLPNLSYSNRAEVIQNKSTLLPMINLQSTQYYNYLQSIFNMKLFTTYIKNAKQRGLGLVDNESYK